MSRPEIDPELLAKWESEIGQTEQNPPAGMELVYANPAVKAKLHEVGLAGMWLKHQLQTAGVEADKIEKFTFAFGQRCFTAPDVWGLAVKTLELYQKGQADLPVFRDLPEDERISLFRTYTKVHSE